MNKITLFIIALISSNCFYKKVQKESDWKTYIGSSAALKKQLEEGKIVKEKD